MIQDLVRGHLREFKPYQSARSEMKDISADREFVFLDANELALGSPVELNGLKLNRYPDPYQRELRDALAQSHQVNAESVFVGVGSDEIIDLLIRLFCEPGKDAVLILQPTYGVYGVSAALNNVRRIDVELNENFHIDTEKTLRAVTSETKLIFCCTPNNPTGNLLNKNDIMKLADAAGCMVVIDEAYAEFADADQVIQPKNVASKENLIILKTLSKAWGSAGIRLGYCVGHPDLIAYLLRIKAPYNINTVTSSLALNVLSSGNFMCTAVATIRKEKEKLINILRTYKDVVHIYPSDANFILVKFRDAERAYEKLLQGGILVRRRVEPRLKNCLRITIGSEEENILLTQILSEMK
ncbi:MAG: histidinol-phosphate transaminase [Bacteroidota bacterium]